MVTVNVEALVFMIAAVNGRSFSILALFSLKVNKKKNPNRLLGFV